MPKDFFSVLLTIGLLSSCYYEKESPTTISIEVDLESLKWVEDQTGFTVSLYDTDGNLIESEQEVQFNKEYEVVIKVNRPVAVYINKNFGFEFISRIDGDLMIKDIHKYRVLKTESGFNQLVLEIYPLYYLNGELIRERPQLFMFPKS